MATHPKSSSTDARAGVESASGAGLCARCAFAESHANARGSSFLRCRRADEDAAFGRYPRLPVLACKGFDPGSPGARESR